MKPATEDSTTTNMYVTALEYELGEDEHDLDDLSGIDPEVKQVLREGGINTYRTTDRSVVELAAGPITRTVAALSDEERSRIKRLIFASNSMWDESLHTANAFSELLRDLGIPDVVPMSASMSWCANFHIALEMSRLLVQDGEECVLVICADLWPKQRADRLVSPRISVHSDAAASFAVSTHGGPFQLHRTNVRLDPALGSLDRNTQLTEYMEGVANGVTGTVGAALGGSLTPDDIARVVPNNYSRWTCRAISQLAGFDESKLFLDNVPRFAHALCADNPINLRDLIERDGVSAGDLLLMLGTGPYQWGASVLEATRTTEPAATAALADSEPAESALS
ncbi:MAG: 3-oxoacyl-[acyl-carrier-protein] synthase III C-terminal domain-containing protein [Solirubrobacterales bacterium]